MTLRPLFASIVLVLASLVSAQDSYYRVPLPALDLAGEALPDWPRGSHHSTWGRFWPMSPYVVLAGPGEAYVEFGAPERIFSRAPDFTLAFLCVRTPSAEPVQGVIYLPDEKWDGMVRREFTITPGRNDPEAEEDFRRAKGVHYLRLAGRRLPGGAVFRHEADVALEGLEFSANLRGSSTNWRTHGQSDLEDSFALFSGGRAVSENLQLDRLLPASEAEEDTVEIDSIDGITVPEMDWEPLLAGKNPPLDPLAARVPADQYALFFPSFDAMATLIDEAKALGTEGLALFAEESRQAFTHERYERQLCLSLDTFSRMLGPTAIKSVAFTGSDPYLRTGSDVAILYEPTDADTLFTFIRARQELTRKSTAGVETVSGKINDTEWHGVVSPTRSVCSYVAIINGTIVVTNSLGQLEKLATIGAPDGATALAESPDYLFFRDRYARGDAAETALLIVPDQAIRQWCSPHWRIATSRRTQAMASLAELQAANLDRLAAGVTKEIPLETRPSFPVLGNLYLTRDGVRSALYGSLDFQTPIAELDLRRVGKREAELYGTWRDGYQRNWSRFFDPIAVRISVADDRFGFDMSVMPLILGTDYDEFRELSGDAKLEPLAGDPHAGALLHFAMALDPQSAPIREIGDFLLDFAGRLGAHPMGWIGGSVSLYLDEDPIWQEIAAEEDIEEAMENLLVDINDIPVSLHFEVASGLKLAAFLSGLRAFVEETAPGMVKWDSREHGEHRYVRITSNEAFFDEIALYYATTPGGFVVSVHEESLKRAIDRLTTPKVEEDAVSEPGPDAAPIPRPEPWLGESLAVDFRRVGLDALEVLVGEKLQEWSLLISWSNLPILNEWKRRFPEADPVKIHELLWGERLVCPAGGKYVWNDQWQTMESTVCGHPGAPTTGVPLPTILTTLLRARSGLTFEENGLRAAVELHRKK